jgi:hypothetical protein
MFAIVLCTSTAWAIEATVVPAGACPDCTIAEQAEHGSTGEGYLFFGPIPLVNQQPPNPVFLSPIPAEATVLPEGESWARFKVDLTNHLIKDEDAGYTVHYDFESARIEPEYHVGLRHGELSLRYMFAHVGSGFMDGMIRGFHQLIQQRSYVRLAGEPYQFEILVAGPDGVIMEAGPDTWAFGDLIVEYKQAIWDKRAGEDALSWRCAVKAPLRGVNSGLLDTGGLDFSFGLLYQRQLDRRLRCYLNFDYVFITGDEWDQVRFNDIPVAVYALEYGLDKRTTAVLQWRSHRNPVSLGRDDTDKDSQELDFAFHHELSEGTVLTLGIGEDARGMTAPDVTLMTYLKWDV